ncbi:MAG TPA: efflux RND transporter permease subunit [Nitrospinota bacterium]|nr:efflux RND transporter permease subunit [Nitrospinota bacterium]|tara:strand:+ start:3957 stop:7058 length:3102 start_codon:yes stop_codon:yes gene_type:complete
MNITELGLNKTILVRLIFILIVGAGVYCYISMPKYLDPDLNFNQAFISTIHKNLAPEDVEKFITTPIEKEIKDIPGIKKMFSTSSANRSSVIIEFDDEIKDMNPIIQELRNEVDKIDDFPDDTEKSVIDDLDTAFFPICLVAVGGELTTDKLFETAEDIAEDIEDIRGISEVEIQGKRERRVYINVDPGKLESYGLTLNNVVREVNRKNKNAAAGHIDVGEHKIDIRLIGKYSDVEDFNNLVFVNKVSDGVIFLKDFASIKTGHEDARTLTKLNSNPALILQVKRKKNSNVINIIDEINVLLDKYKRKSSNDLELTLFNDTSLEIRDRLNVLLRNAGFGMVLVFASLALFLGRRQAIFAFVGIPICFFIAFILMKIFDLSINGISLFALVLVLGMIVDDAIIVLENVYRYLEKGMTKREAIIAGVKEVKWPITSAVLTSMAAFAPLLLVSGIMGKFISVIPKVIIFALSASLFEVLFMMPSHIVEFSKVTRKRIRSNKKKERNSNFRTSPLAIFKKVYLKIIKFCIRCRYVVFLVFVATLILSLAAIPKIGVELFPPNDAFPRFDIKVWLPVGTKLNTTLEKLEEILPVAHEAFGNDIDSLISIAGFVEVEYQGTLAEHVGTINVVLKRERTKSIEKLSAISRQFLKEMNGIEEFKVDRLKEGPPTGSPVEVRIMGDNWDMLEKVSILIKEELNKIKGTVDIRSNYKKNMKEIQVKLKQIEAKKYGIAQEELSNAVRTAFKGIKATVYHEENEEIDVYVRLAEEYRKDFNSILDLNVAAANGQLIPLKEVAFIKIEPTLFEFKHFGRKRTITVTSEIENEITTSSKVNNKLKKTIDKKILKKFPEVSIQYGGEFEETQKSVKEVVLSFSLAMFLVFLILATQFNSFIQPVIVMLAIPFGSIGVVVGLFVSGSYFTFPTMIGIVGLAGVIVNDSIVLISFANSLRKMGGKRKPYFPIIKASLIRFRPIILTTVTTVLGMLPMALGIGGKNPLWAPLANAFVWGISFSTTLILILVPCVYLIVEDIKSLFSKKNR